MVVEEKVRSLPIETICLVVMEEDKNVCGCGQGSIVQMSLVRGNSARGECSKGRDRDLKALSMTENKLVIIIIERWEEGRWKMSDDQTVDTEESKVGVVFKEVRE